MTLLRLSIFGGIISGILIALSIPPFGQVYLFLVAFVPTLMLITQIIPLKKWNQIGLLTLNVSTVLTIWTAISFYWLIEISIASYILCLIACVLTFLLCTAPILFISSSFWRILAFIGSVVLYEVIVNNFAFTSPFVTFAPWVSQYPIFTQYYIFTGVHGGTIWILLANAAIFLLISKKELSIKKTLLASAIIILPPIVSIGIYYTKEIKNYQTNVLVTNTRIRLTDPKFTTNDNALLEYITAQNQLPYTKDRIDIAIFPEGLSNQLGWIDNEYNEPFIQRLNEWRQNNNINSLLIGGLMYKQIHTPSIEPSYQEKDGYYFTTHNVSLQLHDTGIYIQGKEEFVPFQEAIPYPKLTYKLAKYINNIGYKTKISPLPSSQPHFGKHKTLICYEALNPANATTIENDEFLVVVSSESWTKNPTAHKQFNEFLKAIALAQNTTIVKSSNFGTSIVLNNKGETIITLDEETSQLIKI